MGNPRFNWNDGDVVVLEPGAGRSPRGWGPPARPAAFADVPHDEVALAGPDGKQAAKLLGTAKDAGTRTLYYLARRAVQRLLDSPNPLAASHLFDDAEYTALTDQLAKTNATANLLGRARIRERAAQAEHRHAGILTFSDDDCFCAFAEAPPPLPPAQAVSYFKSLVPTLDVRPERFGPLLRREAFTLAAKTDEVMLAKVKDVIGEAITSGRTGGAPADIEDILTRAGVAPKNPQYSEMVFRTNMMDSYNVGAQEELRTPEMADVFPAWQYLGIRDGRQGADHEPKFDRYYPNTAAFAEVRGDRVFNCRCSFRAVDRYEWEDLQKQGARLETSWAAFGEARPAAPGPKAPVVVNVAAPKILDPAPPDPALTDLAAAVHKLADRPDPKPADDIPWAEPVVEALRQNTAAVLKLADRPDPPAPVVNVPAPVVTVPPPVIPPTTVHVTLPAPGATVEEHTITGPDGVTTVTTRKRPEE